MSFVQESGSQGEQMHRLMRRLFPIHRSLTGDGVRQTLQILREEVPELETYEVPSCSKVFDWEVPHEWRIREAYIVDPNGNRFCDIAENNLHLVGYSTPVRQSMPLDDLLPRLHSLPDQPTAIPYVTSYYKEYWGFCISDEQKCSLSSGEYEVVIDSELFQGSLTYGEILLPGELSEEVFISTYVCHPSMCNDQLSGPIVATEAVKWLKAADRRLSYRFAFVPETIGAIAFLHQRIEEMKSRVIAGFNLSCVGDDNAYSMVQSKRANTLADQVATHVLRHMDENFKCYSYLQRGSDERQYCSAGIDLPLCTLSRTKFGEFAEYHTSLDNLDYVTPAGLTGGLEMLLNCIKALEANQVYRMTVACEPQLGKRGLYPNLSVRGNGEKVRDLTNFIAYADGTESLLEIAERLDRPIWSFMDSIRQLLDHDLIQVVEPNQRPANVLK